MMNAHLVIRTEERGYNIIGRAAGNIRGLILVRKDSPVLKARDLKGASISFGARTDLAGAMMQKLLLKQQGLDVERDARPKYVGSPESAIENVYSGRSAAACVSESAWKAFETRRPEIARDLRIRWATMPLMGMGILARRDIPRERVQMVMRVLFDLDDSASGRRILKAMSILEFSPGRRGFLRSSVGVSERLPARLPICSGSRRCRMKVRIPGFTGTFSIRRQLIIGVAIVHLLLMSIFLIDLTSRQRSFLMEGAKERILFQVNVLATSALPHVIVDDSAGLSEIVDAFARDRTIRYAMVTDTQGRVLGHSDHNETGKRLEDPRSLRVLKGPVKPQFLFESPLTVQAVAPIMVQGRSIGWAWLGVNRSEEQEHLDYVTRSGILYTFCAVLIGTMCLKAHLALAARGPRPSCCKAATAPKVSPISPPTSSATPSACCCRWPSC